MKRILFLIFIMFAILNLPLLSQTIHDVSIYEIQYTEDESGDSPYWNEKVRFSGVVTAVFSSYVGSFTVQDSAKKWNAIVVFDGDLPSPARMDNVTIVGKVIEYGGLTEVGTVESITVNSQLNQLPEAIIRCKIASEPYEGVLVKVDSTNCVLSNTEGEIELANCSSKIRIGGFNLMPESEFDQKEFFTEGNCYSVTGIIWAGETHWLQPRNSYDIREVKCPTDLSVTSISSQLRFYPNPFSDYVTIDLSIGSQIQTIELIDIFGRTVKSIDRFEGNSITIQRDNLPGGIYFFRIHSNDTYVKKVMIR